MEIDGTAALVTGGASGLGAATARMLTAHGAQVTIVDLPSSAGQQLADELGESVQFVAADITDEESVFLAVAAAAERAPLRILVGCAGVGSAAKTVGRHGPHPLPDFTRVVGINLIGTYNVIRLAAAQMATNEPVAEERGVIISTASIAAMDGQIGQAAYSASKGGIVGLTLPVARDLASYAIRVMTIAPGLFETPLLGGLPEEARLSLGAQIPHPSRLGQPPEYAALARHIIENPMLNGEVIRLDGAIRMSPR